MQPLKFLPANLFFLAFHVIPLRHLELPGDLSHLEFSSPSHTHTQSFSPLPNALYESLSSVFIHTEYEKHRDPVQ